MNDTLGQSCMVCENAGSTACNNNVSSLTAISVELKRFKKEIKRTQIDGDFLLFYLQIFPINRLRCHTCTENNLAGACFSAVDGNAVACKSYAPDDKCYIRKTSTKKFLFGFNFKDFKYSGSF